MRWPMLLNMGVIVLLFIGCGGSAPEKVAEDEGQGSEEGNPLTAPVDYLGAVNQAQNRSADRLALVGLQQAIQQFQAVEDRLPRTLEEVVSSGYIARLPDPPRGQVLVYESSTGKLDLAPRADGQFNHSP
jgi:hypothetical protein